MDMGTDAVTRSLSSQSVALNVLLDSLSGKTKIAEQDLLDVLTTVCPLNSEDRVDAGRAMPFDSDVYR